MWFRRKTIDSVDLSIQEAMSYNREERDKEKRAKKMKLKALYLALDLTKRFWKLASHLPPIDFPIYVDVNGRKYILEYNDNYFAFCQERNEIISRSRLYKDSRRCYWGDWQIHDWIPLGEVNMFLEDMDCGLGSSLAQVLTEQYKAEHEAKNPIETAKLLARRDIDSHHYLADADRLLRPYEK